MSGSHHSNILQGNTKGRDCPPFSSGCENNVYRQYDSPSLNRESVIEDDSDNTIGSYKRSQDKGLGASFSLSKEHRKLLGILLPLGHPSRPDSNPSSLHSSVVRGKTSWNWPSKDNKDSSSRFTAVIFTQLSAASTVVHFNAPIFKLVSNVAASEYVDKVRI